MNCDYCGHQESDHAGTGWHAGRCLAYPGGCECDGFALSDYDAYGMAPPGVRDTTGYALLDAVSRGEVDAL